MVWTLETFCWNWKIRWKKVTDPGPIDFTNLIDPTTDDRSDEVQLRPDAVEGNDYTFIPYELYQDLVRKT